MTLSFPRVPGLIVYATIDTTVYNKNELFILANTQPTIPDHIHMFHASGSVHIFDGNNFKGLSIKDARPHTATIAELIKCGQQQKPTLVVKYLEDVFGPGATPNPISPEKRTPALNYSLFHSAPRTTTNDYLVKDKAHDKD